MTNDRVTILYVLVIFTLGTMTHAYFQWQTVRELREWNASVRFNAANLSASRLSTAWDQHNITTARKVGQSIPAWAHEHMDEFDGSRIVIGGR